MRYFRLVVFLFVAVMPTMPAASYAAFQDFKPSTTGPVDISAKTLEYDKGENTYRATGEVVVREGTRHLTADAVRYNQDTDDVFAEGNVVYQDGEDVIRCEKMHVNLATKTGSIERGTIYVKEGNFTIAGEQIAKVDEQRYKISKAEFTTCDMPCPDWKFTASDVDLTVGGYARAKGARFHILDQALFYFPYGIFPVKTERESGLLVPEFVSSSRDGFKVKEAYFWAIDKDKDATLSLQYIQRRGLLINPEVRYALKDDLKGAWNYSVIYDKEYGGTRSTVKGEHQQTFFKDTRFKTQVDYVSDYQYLEDFGETSDRRSENLVKSTAYLEQPLRRSLLTVEGAYFKTLESKSNDAIFQYYPHATFFSEYIPLFGTRLYTDVYADFTNFYREEGDTYSRLSIEPRLRLPMSWKGLNFLFSGSVYEKAYLVNYDGEREGTETLNRETVKLEGDANIQLTRNYDIGFLDLGTVRSLVKPQIKYTFVSNTSYRDIPEIDPYDRIERANAITYSLNHYLHALSPAGAVELSTLEISQTYGLSGDLVYSDAYRGYGDRFSDVSAKLRLNLPKNFAFYNETALNVHGKGLSTIRNVLSHSVPSLYSISVDHTYTKDYTSQVDFYLGAKYKYLTGRYEIRYSFRDKDWIDTVYQLIYQPKCWAVILTLTQAKRPRDTSITVSFDLTGITSRINSPDRFLRR